MIQMKTVSLACRLAEELSETGIPFRVDAWENNPPANYGVVELTGQEKAFASKRGTQSASASASGASSAFASSGRIRRMRIVTGFGLPRSF